jgi:hypothetical protein
MINGQLKRIPNGESKLSKRAIIKRNGNKITFSTNDGEEVDFVTFGSFFNVYVRSNVEIVSGICSRQFIKSKIFGHPRKGKIVKINNKKCSKQKMKSYKRSCKRKGLKRGEFKNCVRDLCNGLSRKIERRIVRFNKQEKKKVLKIVKKHRKQKKIRGSQLTCSLYADPHVS